MRALFENYGATVCNGSDMVAGLSCMTDTMIFEEDQAGFTQEVPCKLFATD